MNKILALIQVVFGLKFEKYFRNFNTNNELQYIKSNEKKKRIVAFKIQRKQIKLSCKLIHRKKII